MIGWQEFVGFLVAGGASIIGVLFVLFAGVLKVMEWGKIVWEYEKREAVASRWREGD